MSHSQPGWFPDPTNPSHLRWWDGQQWTAHVQTPQMSIVAGSTTAAYASSDQGAPPPTGDVLILAESSVRNAAISIGGVVMSVLAVALRDSPAPMMFLLRFGVAWWKFLLWFGVAFFGLAAFIAAARVIRPATLRADASGVTETAWPRKTRHVAWSDVERFFNQDVFDNDPFFSSNATDIVCIKLSPTGQHHETFGTAAVVNSETALFSNYGKRAAELAAHLERLRQYHSR